VTDPQIDEYIRANRDRYTRAAITQQLTDAGHDTAAVDAGWTASDAEVEATRGPNPWPRFWRAFWLTALVGAVLIVVVWFALYQGSNHGGYTILAGVFFGMTLLVPMLVGAAVVGFSRRRVSTTTLAAMALWVPIVLVGLSAGTCIAIGFSGA